MTVNWQRQRKARRIAMTDGERDAFLAGQRTCRVATASAQSGPHVAPLWYVWDGQALWMSSLVRSRRWQDLLVDPRCAVVIDAGERYDELRGVELYGTVEAVGEVPRTGEANAGLESIEAAFAAKYRSGEPFAHDGRHAWLRLRPERQFTWDFRKIPA